MKNDRAGRWWLRPSIAPAQLPPDADAVSVRFSLTQSSSPSSRHGGVPMGCVALRRRRDVGALRTYLASRVGPGVPLRFRGVDALPPASGGDPECGAAVHLPPEAAAVCEGADAAAFLDGLGAAYYPGVRARDPLWEALTSEVAAALPIRPSFPAVGEETPPPPPPPPPPTPAPVPPPAPRFTFAEIFAGIGGFRLGMEPLGGRCVLASEIDGGAVETYAQNFHGEGGAVPRELLIGDVRDYGASQLPEFDVLTGGFPCQSFSARGYERGLADARVGQLFRELVRLLRARRPKAFLFENVAGLVTGDGGGRIQQGEGTVFVTGGQFAVVLDAFAAEGYDVSWRVVNARHWLPQNRERVYIVGIRADLRAPEMDWSAIPSCGGGSGPQKLGVPSTAMADAVAKGTMEPPSPPAADRHPGKKSTVRDILDDDPAQRAAAGLTKKQWEVVRAQLRARPPRGKKRALDAEDDDAPSADEVLLHRSIPLDGKAPTITSGYHNSGNITSRYIFSGDDDDVPPPAGRGGVARFLTPRECARAMGFPDSFVIPRVDTEGGRGRFYRQIGNAVCPPVIGAVAEQILRALEGAPSGGR